MTLPYRKAIREAIVAALDAGFNGNHQTLAAEYAVDPISLDFSNGSRNFCQVKINPEELELVAPLDLDGYAMALWTDPAVETGRIRGIKFDGEVIFHVLGIIQRRDGAEPSNTEDIMDAFEAATLYTLNSYAWPLDNSISLIYARETRIDRHALMPLDDGWRQMFDLSGKFTVRIP
jgi:hypothetical protein